MPATCALPCMTPRRRSKEAARRAWLDSLGPEDVRKSKERTAERVRPPHDTSDFEATP